MKFYIKDRGDSAYDAVDIGDGNGWHRHDSFTAEGAADIYHDNYGGWESSWPMTITLVDDNGTESDWDVDRESVPSFYATKAG